jgi:hypothetical protein
MSKTLVTLVTAGLLALLATVGAAATPQTVTISASRPSVVFGKSVTLSGKVSNSKAGESVSVLAEPSGTSTFAALATVQTVSGGHWSQVVKPTIETSYQANWKGATSSTSVKVRPLSTLTLVNRATGSFSSKVSAARSFAGKFVLVQRLTSTGVSTLKRVTLDANSEASFRVRLHRGRSRLRVVMPTSQTAPGYITGTSNVVAVLR